MSLKGKLILNPLHQGNSLANTDTAEFIQFLGVEYNPYTLPYLVFEKQLFLCSACKIVNQ